MSKSDILSILFKTFFGNTIIQKDGIFEMRNSKLYFLPVIPSKNRLANFREAGVIALATRQFVHEKNEKRR